MEALLIRIDALRDRRQYVAQLKDWLAELAIAHGRLVTMGEVHLLFIAAETAQLTKLLEFYATRNIDTNSRGEPCVDRFIDIVGRKSITAAGCKGFLEMNILNKTMLEKMLVHEWHGESEWIESALATPRTRAMLAWREAFKAQRKDQRQKSAKNRLAAKEQKKQQAEAAAAVKAAQALADAAAAAMSDGDDSDDNDDNDGDSSKQQQHDASSSVNGVDASVKEADDSDDGSAAVAPTVEAAPVVRPQQPKTGRNKHKRPADGNGTPQQQQQQSNKQQQPNKQQPNKQQQTGHSKKQHQHSKQPKGTKRQHGPSQQQLHKKSRASQ